jgi:DNA-binding NarL/FixJ family response regulator
MVLFAGTVSGDWSKRLSPRECEVAHLAARGLSNKHIARDLKLSDGTVKQHVHSIFQKLGVKKRYGLMFLIRAAV